MCVLANISRGSPNPSVLTFEIGQASKDVLKVTGRPERMRPQSHSIGIFVLRHQRAHCLPVSRLSKRPCEGAEKRRPSA